MQSAVKVWRKQQIDKQHISQVGIIESWTTVYVAPPQFDAQTPYTIVLVVLENGSRTYGQFVDFNEKELRIGQHVISTLRVMANVNAEELIEYGIKFKPQRK